VFDRFVEIVEGFGPVNVYAQKTGIVFQVRVRFARAMPKQRWLDGHFWLKRRASHPRLTKVEHMLRRDWIHWFRLSATDNLDRAFITLLRESYRIGEQKPP
jgi:Domain of unknown function (DUF5655)